MVKVSQVLARAEEKNAAEKTKVAKKKKKDLEANEKIQSLQQEIQRLHPPAKSEKDLDDSQLKSLTLTKLKTLQLLQYKKDKEAAGKCIFTGRPSQAIFQKSKTGPLYNLFYYFVKWPR